MSQFIEVNLDSWNDVCKERDALRERVQRLTTALEVIGNEAGSPTMDYEQKIENRELRSSRTRIYKMVRKALSIPEGER